MFVSAVAPTSDKTPKGSDPDLQKSPICNDQDSECGIHHSGFFKTVKYPVILMNMGGIYVPSFCVCEKEPCYNEKAQKSSQDIIDSDSNDDNTRSFMYVQCVKGNCLGDHLVPKKCPDDDSPWWAVVKKVACIVMIICHLTNSIRCVFILQHVSDNEGVLLFSLANYFIFNSFFYLLALNSYACLKHFTPFLAAVHDYERKYGFKCKFKTCSKNNFILFCSVIVCQFAQGAIIIYGILTFSNNMSPQLWPLSHWDGVLRFFGAFVVGFGVFFAACNQYGAHCFRAVVTTMLHGEFQRLTADIPDILSNTGDSSYSELLFDQVLEKFKVICDLMDKGYDVIKHTIAAGYIFGIPTLCLVLFGVIKRSIQLDHFLVLSVNTLAAVFILVHTTWTLARLKSQIKSVCTTVYLANWSSFSPQLLQKLLLFTNMFSTHHFGLTVYGIFIVDWSTILAVGGTLVAYGVIVIQFELGASSYTCNYNNKSVS